VVNSPLGRNSLRIGGSDENETGFADSERDCLGVLAIAIRNVAAEQFYQGKTIRIVVEAPAGAVRLAC
jgi:hypothetical protein